MMPRTCFFRAPPAPLAALAAALLVGLLPYIDVAAAEPRQPAGSIAGDFLVGISAQRHGDWTGAAYHYSAALMGAPQASGLRATTILAGLMAGDIDGALARLDAGDPGLTGAPAAMAALARATQAIRQGRADVVMDAAEHLTGMPLDQEISFVLRAIGAAMQAEAGQAQAMVDGLRNMPNRATFADMLEAMLADLNGDAATAARLYAEVEKQTPTLRTIAGRLSALQRAGDTAGFEQALSTLSLTQGTGGMGAELLAQAKSGQIPALVHAPADAAAEILYDLAIGFRQQAPDLSTLLLRLALDLRTDLPLALMLLAEIQEDAERPDLAVKAYNQAITQTSEGTALRWLLRQRHATALYQAKHVDAAITALKEMIAERGDQLDVLGQLGNVLRWEKRYDEAVQTYNGALAIQPDNWRLLYYRGIARHELDDWTGAEADLVKAMAIEPEDPYLLNFLGYSWVERGQNLDQAKQMIEKAVALRPQDGFITDSLGWAFFQMGQFEDAVDYLERAVELEPYDPVINDHLGDAYWRVGRLNEARFQWRRAMNESKDAALTEATKAKLDNGLDG